MDHTEIIAASNSRWLVLTLQYQASARDSHLSFFFFKKQGFFFIYCYQHLFPSASFKKINKCIPLCFILYLLISYVSYLFLLLYYFKTTRKNFVILCMTRLVAWFLAKSEGLVFPLPYPEAGGQVWHFGHSMWRPNPESQFRTQGWGEWCGPFSLSHTVSPNHRLLA